MKKTTAIAAALLAAAIVLATLAGCNGDESKAREYIKAAQENGKAVARTRAELQDKSEALTGFANIQEPTPEDYASMEKFTAEIVALVDAVNKAAQSSRLDYERVLDLKGAEKYKKYAEVQIEALELIDARSKLVKDLATITGKILDAEISGQPIDETAVTASIQRIIEERNRLTREIEKLSSEASDLAEGLNLY